MTHIRRAFGRWLPLAGLVIGTCLLAHLSIQQVLRSGADDPQIQMAEDAAQALASGTAPESLLPPPVDFGVSLAPFLAFLDDRGAVTASSGSLHGRHAVPPSGVLEFVRHNGRERISWQPEGGVRIAAMVLRTTAPSPGFVVAGRNLREVEQRELSSLRLCSLAAAVLLAGTALLVLVGEFLAPGGLLGAL
jgi:hypothetical protein